MNSPSNTETPLGPRHLAFSMFRARPAKVFYLLCLHILRRENTANCKYGCVNRACPLQAIDKPSAPSVVGTSFPMAPRREYVSRPISNPIVSFIGPTFLVHGSVPTSLHRMIPRSSFIVFFARVFGVRTYRRWRYVASTWGVGFPLFVCVTLHSIFSPACPTAD